MNLEHQKQNFKNHIATLTDLGNIKILDFADPNSSHYRIRFLFEEDYCRLHISGDLGELVATNYNNMRFEKFTDFTRNTGYFREKINCHSRPLDVYDYNLAEQELRERIIEERWLDNPEFYDLGYTRYEDDEESIIEEGIRCILRDYENNGIGTSGFQHLSKIDEDAWEWAYDLGKKDTGILDLYMLAFTLATEQLKSKEKTNSTQNKESDRCQIEDFACFIAEYIDEQDTSKLLERPFTTMSELAEEFLDSQEQNLNSNHNMKL